MSFRFENLPLPIAGGPRLGAILLAMAATACNTVPGAGPTTDQILAGGDSVEVTRTAARYALVSVDLAAADGVNAASAPPLPAAGFFGDDPRPPLQPTIRSGDDVAVTIVNVNRDGFVDFAEASVSPLATTGLPPQTVGPDGRIGVPPIGRVPAAGRTPERLENELEDRLGRVLVEPSVIVQITSRRVGQVSVLGEVARPGYFPLLAADTRLSDLIGAAGGPTAPADEVEFTLVRDGEQASVRFDRFLQRPAWDIRVWPGDILRFEPARRRYTVLGAVALNGRYEFDEPSLTLAEALATGRGLNNLQAARNGVFVYRQARLESLRRVSARPVPFSEPTVPTVFHFDLGRPAVLFAAQTFRIRDGDMIYVPDAPLTEISKVLSVFNLGVDSAQTVFVVD